jgi:hypothetical protein
MLNGITVEFSSDSGATWDTLITNTNNDGEYGWVVPAVPSSLCLVRIAEAEAGGPVDLSDSCFAISAVTPAYHGSGRGAGSRSSDVVVYFTLAGKRVVQPRSSSGVMVECDALPGGGWLRKRLRLGVQRHRDLTP